MALVATKMRPKIQKILGGHNKRPKWDKIIKAWAGSGGYLADGMNAAGQQTISVSGFADAGQKINEIMKKNRKSGAAVPGKVAKEIAKCMDTYTSTYQTVITTAPAFFALLGSMEKLMAAPTESKTKMTNDLVKALDTYSKAVMVAGIIPGSPPVPFGPAPLT